MDPSGLLSLLAVATAAVALVHRRDRIASPVSAIARRRRDARATALLPDALRRLGAELAAGRTLERALSSVGAATAEPMGVALRSSARSIAAGATVEQALAAALPPGAGELAAAAIGLQHRAGGNLAAHLRTLATVLEERERVEADVRSLTAQARLSAAVVPLLPLVGLLGLTAADPAGTRALLSTPAGLGMLAVAVLLDGAGALAVWRIVRRVA